jgi:hypothetical protein
VGRPCAIRYESWQLKVGRRAVGDRLCALDKQKRAWKKPVWGDRASIGGD